jgi:hypothetical protein
MLRQDSPCIGVDNHLVDLFDGQQRIEYPAKQRLSIEITEVLPLHSLTVCLHGQQCDDSLFIIWHVYSPLSMPNPIEDKNISPYAFWRVDDGNGCPYRHPSTAPSDT